MPSHTSKKRAIKKKKLARAGAGGGSKKKKTATKIRRKTSATATKDSSLKANNLPSNKIRNFAKVLVGLNGDLTLDQSKHGFAIRHPKYSRIIIGMIGSPTTLRIASYKFDPDKDAGVYVDGKGYPHVILERPGEDEVRKLGVRILKRLKLATASAN
jgi:hypothetical protein